MTRLADLARSLGAVELSTARENATSLHTLNLEFPVPGLLPDDVSAPYLESPALVNQREPPPKDASNAGIYDTAFFARLPVQPRNPFAVTPARNSHAALLAVVDAASATPGTTHLEMVSFQAPDTGSVMHRLRLRTELVGASTPALDFEFDDERWRQLLQHGNRVVWIRLLNNIVRRGTARAYYHVRARLFETYGEEVANAEEAVWSASWSSQRPRSIKELLFARLLPGDAGQSLAAGGDRTLMVKPPCGHESMLRKISVVGLMNEACLTFACPLYGERVLQSDDDNELGLRNVCLRAQAFLANNGAWTDMDQEIGEEREALHLPATAIMCALSGALGSLRLPALISPPEMSFIGLEETGLVFAEVEDTFGEGDWTITSTARELFDSLIGLASNALESRYSSSEMVDAALPLGWEANLRRWFTRAVRLVSDRGCERDGRKHAGLHMHRGEFRCGVKDMREYDDATNDNDTQAEGEPVMSMDELTKLMTGSNIEE